MSESAMESTPIDAMAGMFVPAYHKLLDMLDTLFHDPKLQVWKNQRVSDVMDMWLDVFETGNEAYEQAYNRNPVVLEMTEDMKDLQLLQKYDKLFGSERDIFWNHYIDVVKTVVIVDCIPDNIKTTMSDIAARAVSEMKIDPSSLQNPLDMLSNIMPMLENNPDILSSVCNSMLECDDNGKFKFGAFMDSAMRSNDKKQSLGLSELISKVPPNEIEKVKKMFNGDNGKAIAMVKRILDPNNTCDNPEHQQMRQMFQGGNLNLSSMGDMIQRMANKVSNTLEEKGIREEEEKEKSCPNKE